MEKFTNIVLSDSEKSFITDLTQIEFRTNDKKETTDIDLKLNDLLKKFEVTSFEEVLRKVIFYRLLDVNISKTYSEYTENYAKDRIAIRNTVRNLMLDFVQNATVPFCKLSYYAYYASDKKRQNKFNRLIENVKSDVATKDFFNKVNSFISLVNNMYDFNSIFNNEFRLTDADEDFLHDLDIIVNLLESSSLTYLFIAQCVRIQV